MIPNSLSLVVLSLLILAGYGAQKTPQPPQKNLRVMSYNIKYDDPSAGIDSWDQRKESLVNFVHMLQPDFMGTQEALYQQVLYLNKHLPGMNWIGVGRKDGKKEGEFSALFYNENRFELVSGSDSTLWLSKTPSKPSKSWDAALPRILTWGKFKDKEAGKSFFVFNTHFDHLGDTARAKSAGIILHTIIEVAGDAPVILTGDFNMLETSAPYQILTDPSSPLKDSYYTSVRPHVGPQYTFCGFEVQGDTEKQRIDYIFTNNRLRVLSNATVPMFREGHYLSDHLPVVADMKF